MSNYRTSLVGIVVETLIVCTMAITVTAQTTSQSASQAPAIKVDCNKKGSIGATLAHLTQIGNTRGVTISVTGTCTENITIGAFDHLVLQGSPSATIQDASNGTATVIDISSSFDVTVQSFTINGGALGVNCHSVSFCALNFNTIQQSAGAGVRVGSSKLGLTSNNILNNAAYGVLLRNGSSLFTGSNQITNNGAAGIAVFDDSYLFADADIIQNNALGIRALDNSVVRAVDVTISNNGSDGVRLESGSGFSGGGNLVTGNGGNGVAVYDLSFAGLSGFNNVSGNLGQPDVACYPQYSATRGAGTVGGTTNCIEP